MNSNTAAFSSGDGIEEASRLVKSIRYQLTEGDAPSGNFDKYPDRNKTGRFLTNESSNHDGASVTASEPSVSSSSVGVDRLSKQLRFPPRPPSDALLSPRSSFTNNTSNISNNKLYLGPSLMNESLTIGSELMGTSSLADLCSQTVNSIDRIFFGFSSSEKNNEQPSIFRPINNNNGGGQKEEASNFIWDDTDISNMGSFSFEVEEEGETAFQKTSLKTPEVKKKGKSTTSPSDSIENSVGNHMRRTVMFGSEYARILSSSSPLSPSSHNAGQRSMNARKMRQSIKARFTSSNKESVESDRMILSLEDCPNAVATAAITDVIITTGNNVVPPKGYYRAFSVGKKKEELLYVNVKKEPNWDRAVQRPCVTAICVIYPDRNEFVPPGFSVVRYYQQSEGKVTDNSNNVSSPANVNPSNSGERVYLCYRRSREGNPLTGLMCLQPSKGDIIPEGYTVLEKTPRNFLADLTANADQPLFLAYRQRLENLECLRPLPLVLSVIQSKQDLVKKELKAYYCTGGTAVASDVGQLHIMDRSTHNILSSSSAQSRLKLIQMAREGSSGNGTAVPSWISSTSSSHSSTSHMKGKSEDSSHSFSSDLDQTPFFGDFNSVGSSPSQRSMASLGSSNSKFSLPLLRQFDDNVQASLDTMHFIPPIESANSAIPDSSLQSRVAIICPILTACYTSQGGSALVAVEGLTKLLNDTDFFARDVADADNVIEASGRLTLIDLAVQVVCDVATTTSRETYFRSCVDFVSDAVRYANGRLNDRTTGFIMRFYLFVYYFGASVPTSGWPFIKDDYLLSDEIEMSLVGVYLPGGAPQAAAIALREFVSIMIASIGTEKGKSVGLSCPSNTEEEKNSVDSQVRMITSDTVKTTIDVVDLANYTQLALYQIHRSGGSELFWHDMINQCGMGLFSKHEDSNQMAVHANIISFAILASFIKIASGKVRIISNNADPVPRDVASKLLSLELIFHYIQTWHTNVCPEDEEGHYNVSASFEHIDTHATATMVYLIRRMVAPTLLSNTSASIEDCRVYQRVLRITSYLWCTPYFRLKMKVDLAVLIEHFVLKILCLGPQISPSNGAFESGSIPSASGDMPSLLNQQLAVLEELKVWFSNPKVALDLYVNYDSPEEMIPPAYCKLLNKLIEALCTLCEKCAKVVSDHGRFTSISASPKRSTRTDNAMIHVREAALAMRNICFDVIALVVKSMMDCSENLPTDQHQLLLQSHSDSFDIGQSFSHEMTPPLGVTDGENIVDYWHTSIEKRKSSLHPIVNVPNADSSHNTASPIDLKQSTSGESTSQKSESLETAFDLISRKGMKKGIDYLIAKNILTRSPKHVSSFLRVHQSSIDPVILGEYLGEGGIDGIDKDYWNLIRFYYVRAVSFVGMNIEKALRHFLTNCGFRLPGEAQRIDRVVSTFSQCYWEDNAGDMANCPFQDQDTCFLISFAIIMLNTDIHKSQPTKSKTLKKMTRSEFIANLRHVCAADKFQNYIYDIYDAIEMAPILVSPNSPKKGKKKKRRGHGNTTSLPFKHDKDYATSLYAWVKSAKSTQELLRTLADQNDNDLVVNGEKKDEDTDQWYVTHQMFSANWHHIFGLINTTVENAHIDISGLDAAIATLEFSLRTASSLDMSIEIAAFSKLLERLNRFNGLKVHAADDNGALRNIDESLSATENTNQVENLTNKLQTSLFVDDTKVQTMKIVANRIRNGEVLLNDPSRIFVREGDLIKRHQLAGRSSTYRFFLFSDVLVYAHKSSQGDYVVHEELPLHLMKIEDIGVQLKSKQHSFFIHHPNKSFTVITSGKAEKQLWMEDIRNSINSEISRKAKVEAARLKRVKRSAK